MDLSQKTSAPQTSGPSTPRATPANTGSSLELEGDDKPLSEKIPESRGDLADQAENQIEATIREEIDRARGYMNRR